MFAIGFYLKLNDSEFNKDLVDNLQEKITYFASVIYQALHEIQAVYQPAKIEGYFRGSQKQQDKDIGVFHGNTIRVGHKELYYQEHFMSLLRRNLTVLDSIKDRNSLAERAVIFRVAQILGEMETQLPAEVKHKYTRQLHHGKM